jgi:uncharacterized protein
VVFLLRTYWLATLATCLIWLAVFLWGGWSALFLVVILTMLEFTFSADNAVINSKVLTTMSVMWQRLFMTLGIFIAVFVVRFAMPIFIVMLTAGLSFGAVFDLVLNNPLAYEHELAKAEPVINAFGGTFLLMIALSYFIDYEKKTHWLKWLESHLGKLGRFDNITVFIMLLAAIILFFTTDTAHQAAVLVGSIMAMTLHIGLELIEAIFEKSKRRTLSLKPKVGMAALAAFLYLEILDASFSLDGVIGAFAITNNVLIIIAGLGAGAVWVRALTVHMVRAKTLNKYIYLEHGAHWAIAFLGAAMLLHLYNLTLPEWVVGSLGLVLISLAILWSKRVNARKS